MSVHPINRCSNCKRGERVPAHRSCKRCLDYFRTYDRERSALSKRNGLCVRCHKADAVPGLASCAACREYGRQAAADRYAQAKQAGKCTKCWRARSVPGHMHCEPCREKANSETKARYVRKSGRVLHCSRCWEPGHFSKTCKAPSIVLIEC